MKQISYYFVISYYQNCYVGPAIVHTSDSKQQLELASELEYDPIDTGSGVGSG